MRYKAVGVNDDVIVGDLVKKSASSSSRAGTIGDDVIVLELRKKKLPPELSLKVVDIDGDVTVSDDVTTNRCTASDPERAPARVTSPLCLKLN